MSGKKLPVLLLLTSLILGGLVPYISVQTAHAANTTPLVCIAQPVIDKICPATGPPTFNGNFTQPDSTRLLFTVFINGSDPMNGFDITLKSSNPSVLKPQGVDLTRFGTVVPGQITQLALCVGTVRVLGTCSAPSDAGTLQYAVIGGGGQITGANTTGTLFTAIFSIVGQNAAGSPVTIGFQTGCIQTSLADSTCVTISNGTPSPNTETIRPGYFDNNTPPSTGIIAKTSVRSIGPLFAGSLPISNAATINVTALSQFEIFGSAVTLSYELPVPPGTTPPTITLSPASMDFSSSTTPAWQLSTLTVTIPATVLAKTYNVTVLADYQVQDTTFGTTDFLDVTVKLTINVVNFSIALSPASQNVQSKQNNSASSTVTIQPINNFNGQVGLSVTLAPAAKGLNATVNPNTISSSQTSTLTVTTNSSLVEGSYAVNVHATSTLTYAGRSTSKSVVVAFTLVVTTPVHKVGISTTTPAPSPTTTVTIGNNVTLTVTVQNQGPQPENVTVTILADNITVASESFTIAANSPGQNVTLVWDTKGYAAKTYTLQAEVSLVSGATNTGSSTYSFGSYTLTPQQTSSGLSLIDYVVIGGVVALVAVGSVIYILRRRSSTTYGTGTARPQGNPSSTPKTRVFQVKAVNKGKR